MSFAFLGTDATRFTSEFADAELPAGAEQELNVSAEKRRAAGDNRLRSSIGNKLTLKTGLCNGSAKPSKSLVTSFMFLKPSKLVLAFPIILTASFAIFAQATGPKAAVMAFYKYDAAHSQVFNRKNIDARKRWFSDELYTLFLKELEREKDYFSKNPTDKPHFGDGLPFRPLDEACELNGKSYRRAISYGQVTVKGNVGNVDVYFKYPKSCNVRDVLYAVNMEKDRVRWVISDLRYIEDNTSLVEDLDRNEY